MTQEAPKVICLTQQGLDDHLPDLAEILHSSVHNGASVGFILPFSIEESRNFWISKVRPGVATGDTILMVAKFSGRVAGTVQLDCATPPNQPHRGVVAKLLVRKKYQKRGIARLLMAALEGCARDNGRHLMTLDTRTGDVAEPLYRSIGYQTAGIIPGFCLAPEGDCFDATTYMYKAL